MTKDSPFIRDPRLNHCALCLIFCPPYDRPAGLQLHPRPKPAGISARRPLYIYTSPSLYSNNLTRYCM